MKKLIAFVFFVGSIHLGVERVSCAEVAFPLARASCAYLFAQKYASEPGKAHSYLAAYYAAQLLIDGAVLSAADTPIALRASEGFLSLALVARHGWLAYKGWREHNPVDDEAAHTKLTRAVATLAFAQIWVELTLWSQIKNYKRYGLSGHEDVFYRASHLYPHGTLKVLLCCHALLNGCFLMIEKDPSKAVVAGTVALNVFSLATAMPMSALDELRSENMDLEKRYRQADQQLDAATALVRAAEEARNRAVERERAFMRDSMRQINELEMKLRVTRISSPFAQVELDLLKTSNKQYATENADLRKQLQQATALYNQTLTQLQNLQASGGGSGMQDMQKALEALPPREMQKLFKSCTYVLHTDNLAKLGLSPQHEKLLTDFYKCLSNIKSANDGKPFDLEK